MVNTAGEPKVWITIVEDIATRTNIARRVLATTMRKDLKPIWRNKIWRPIPRKLWSSNTTINARRRSRRQMKARRSLIVDDSIFIETEAKKDEQENPNQIYWTHYLYEKLYWCIDRVPPPLPTPGRPAEGGGAIYGRGGGEARVSLRRNVV